MTGDSLAHVRAVRHADVEGIARPQALGSKQDVLSAYLPESTRLLMLKSDGSVLVHADASGDKPLKR